MLAHHLSQQKAKSGLMNILEENSVEFGISADTFNKKEINKTSDPKIFEFLKYSLNTIETNSIAENQALESKASKKFQNKRHQKRNHNSQHNTAKN